MPRQDYGIKISKPFRDATTAGDADLMFNSSWPSLPIAYETTIVGQTGTIDVSHPLGFTPFFQVWRYKNGVSIRHDIQQSGLGASAYARVSSTNIQIREDPTDTNADYHVKLYNIDLSVQRDYEFVKPPANATSYDPNYGIKVAREGADIDSTDLRDFIIHSRAQSPQILSVVTEESQDSTNTIKYRDPQGYVSWVFGYIRDNDGYYRFVPYEASGYPQLFITGTTIYDYSLQYLTAGNDAGATLLVLRDPMFAATDVSASY